MNPESYELVSNPLPDADVQPVVLFAGQSQTKPMHKLGPKVVDYYLLHTIESGRGIYTTGGVSHKLGAGDSFLIEPGKLIQYEADEEQPWKYRWVAFSGGDVPRLLGKLGLSAKRPVRSAEDPSAIAEALGLIQSTLAKRTAHASHKASGLLLLLLASLAEAAEPKAAPAWEQSPSASTIVQQALRYMTSQYAEPITIESMADTLGYNRAYLSALFKKETGVTPVTFLLHYRIDKARLLLRERLELTIEQIALSVGFQDPLYFSKQYKRRYGISPSAYRISMSGQHP